MFTASLPGNRLPTARCAVCADSVENSFTSIVTYNRVYRAVAWQRFEQICYTTLSAKQLFIKLNKLGDARFDFRLDYLLPGWDILYISSEYTYECHQSILK
jgi:hypothetical protein